MSIWKDLLFLGGHVATEAGLAALGEPEDAAAVPPVPPQEADVVDNRPPFPLRATR